MSEEVLQIDYWEYSIGKRSGLHHKIIGSSGEPKRIHINHTPQHHREQVQAFQNAYRQKHELVALVRHNNNKNTSKTTNTTTTTRTTITSSFGDDNTTKSDFTAGKKNNNNNSQKPKKKEKKSEVIVLPEEKEETEAKLILPTSPLEVAENINKLQSLTQDFSPEWSRLKLQKTFILQPDTRIYYSSSITLERANHLASHRQINEEVKYPLEQSAYEKSKQTDDELLGFYAKTNVSFDKGITITQIKTYVAGEAYDSTKQSCETYGKIFSKMLLCCIEKQCNVMVIQLESSLAPRKVLENAWATIAQDIKKQNLDITTHFIGDENYKTFQDAIKISDEDKTLFVIFNDMRYVLNQKSMFHNVSSLPLQICNLTNMHMSKDCNFCVH